MPHLKFRGFEKTDITLASTELVDALQALLDCPREYFTLECQTPTFILDGHEVSIPPMVHVEWFDRGQETQDRAATLITQILSNHGYAALDIYFTHLERANYYENGQHF